MEIILENKDIKRHVKNYFKEHYGVRRVRVQLISENVRDRIQELDLFHHDDIYFNIFFRAKVTGLVVDQNKKTYKLDTVVGEENLRSIVRSELSKDFDVQDLKFGYQIYDENTEPGIHINFLRAKAKVEKKQEFQKTINVKNK